MSFTAVRNLCLVILVGIIIIMGLLSFVGTRKITNSLYKIMKEERPALDSVMYIRRNFLEAKSIFYSFTRGEEEDVNKVVRDINKAIKESTKLKDLVKEEQKEVVDRFMNAAKRFRLAAVTYATEFVYDPTGATAIDMEEIADTAVEEASDILNKMINDTRARIRAADINMLIVAKTNQRLIWVGVLTGVIAGLFVAFFMGHALSTPLRELASRTERIIEGDLTSRVKVESTDEIGQLATSFNKMTESLSVALQQEKQLAEKARKAAEAEKKKADELIRAYTKLEELQDMVIQAEKLNAVGQLASGVAHEVKNPLGIIIQGVGYLSRHVPPEKGTSEVLDMIKTNVKRADNIVRTLVDFSRATKLERRPEDINSILKSSLDLVQHRIKTEEIKIISEMEEDLPKTLVDKGKMEQVFVNLFLNAIQAMPNGGSLTIRSHLTHLNKPGNGIGMRNRDSFTIGEKAIMVEAEDTGMGMSEEIRKKVFDPFFSTKVPNGGAGLGLSVTKNIITMHKGIIEVKSQEGKGTKVIVVLKIHEG